MNDFKIKSILVDFLEFIKRPTDFQINFTFKNKLFTIFTILILELLLTLLIVLPIQYILLEFLPLEEAILDPKWQTVSILIIFMIIIIPFIEEIVFRYILRYNRLFQKIIDREKWNKIFPFLVYFFSLSFGVVHATNYIDDTLLFYFLSPLVILSQMIGGFTISYIRVRLNFFSGFLYHIIWNTLFGLIVPAISLFISGSYIDKQQNYSLQIEEKLFFNKKNVQKVEIDSDKSKIYKIDVRQQNFQHILDTIYGKNKLHTENFLLNMKLESKKGISKDEFKKILKKEYEIRKSE